MIVYTLGEDEALPDGVDLIELRPDRNRQNHLDRPYLLTNQPPNEGASYCDVPYPSSIFPFKKQFPLVKWIYSFHGPFESVEKTKNLIEQMFEEDPDLVKCCFDSLKITDFLDLIGLFEKYQGRLILFGRGERSQSTRLLSYYLGAPWIYTSKEGFHGQIPLDELRKIYHIQRVRRDTKIFALIKGESSPPSIGYRLYNPLFFEKGINALYLNLVIEPMELKKVMNHPLFSGFSITMPFKNRAFEYAKNHDENALKCRTINTYFQGVGYNTDVEVLKQLSFVGKKVGILGGGGVSLAFANSLKEQCDLKVFMRDPDKRGEFELMTKVRCDSLENIDLDLDILIDTLPIHWDPKNLKQTTHVLDMKVDCNPAYSKQSMFINGREAFKAQGKKQLQIFFGYEIFL
jgi:shikimate 5-dehydrogenase